MWIVFILTAVQTTTFTKTSGKLSEPTASSTVPKHMNSLCWLVLRIHTPPGSHEQVNDLVTYPQMGKYYKGVVKMLYKKIKAINELHNKDFLDIPKLL